VTFRARARSATMYCLFGTAYVCNDEISEFHGNSGSLHATRGRR
jgi:hypothetical protein